MKGAGTGLSPTRFDRELSQRDKIVVPQKLKDAESERKVPKIHHLKPTEPEKGERGLNLRDETLHDNPTTAAAGGIAARRCSRLSDDDFYFPASPAERIRLEIKLLIRA